MIRIKKIVIKLWIRTLLKVIHSEKSWNWWDFHGRNRWQTFVTHVLSTCYYNDKDDNDNVYCVIWNTRDVVNYIWLNNTCKCPFCYFLNITDSALFAVCEDNLQRPTNKCGMIHMYMYNVPLKSWRVIFNECDNLIEFSECSQAKLSQSKVLCTASMLNYFAACLFSNMLLKFREKFKQSCLQLLKFLMRRESCFSIQELLMSLDARVLFLDMRFSSCNLQEGGNLLFSRLSTSLTVFTIVLTLWANILH